MNSAIQAINIYAAPIFILVIILLDYCSNRNADRMMRLHFIVICASAAAAMLSNVLFYSVRYIACSSSMRTMWLHVSLLGFYGMQQIAVSAVAMLMDYNINRSVVRIRRLAYLLSAFSIINVVLLAANISGGFLYYIKPDELFFRGSVYWMLPAVPYATAAIGIVNLCLSYKRVTRHQIKLLLVLAVPTILASAVDLMVVDFQLQWPVFCASLLFIYLFLVRFEYGLDSLTGIHNRRACDDYLHGLARAAREPHLFAMIDVDCFKLINDTHGHAQGDSALREVASILKSCVRITDFVGRYGGDEFLVILRPPAQAVNFIKRVNKVVAEYNQKKNRTYGLQLSIGCDIYDPVSGATPLQFLEHVDRLMYMDKESHTMARQMRNDEC